MSRSYEKIVAFHGHSCPGLAIGYRMATAALKFLRETQAPDEELVAVTENDACGVDALQCLTGCTFGKGNLLFKDHGKLVFTILSRKSGRGVRVHYHGRGVPDNLQENRQLLTDWILGGPEVDILSLRRVAMEEPEKARIRTSLMCEFCGEKVMENRTRMVNGKISCIPCALEVPVHWCGFSPLVGKPSDG